MKNSIGEPLDAKGDNAQVVCRDCKVGMRDGECPVCHGYVGRVMGMATSEHDTIQSRVTGRNHEIKFGPMPSTMGTDHTGSTGGLVPKNPFASIAQAKFAHANPEKFGGESGLKEWDSSTDFKKLPKKK